MGTLIVVLGIVPAFERLRAAPLGMMRIPTTRLLLGTDMDGLMAAAESCARRHEKGDSAGTCAPEDLAIELSSGSPIVVESFYLDKFEVSVAAYERCVNAGRCRAPARSGSIDHFSDGRIPVVFVSFDDAESYCNYRGARLPSEAEYEAAARGPRGRTFPWGNLFHAGRANAGKTGADVTDDRDGSELLAPVAAYRDGISPQGVFQLSGNAAEWTSSRFGPHESKEGDRPSGYRVIKGGSFADDPIALRATARQKAQTGLRSPRVGFRCAESAAPSPPPDRK